MLILFPSSSTSERGWQEDEEDQEELDLMSPLRHGISILSSDKMRTILL